MAKSIVWTTTYTLYAADKEGLVLQIQRQVVHMIDAAHKEILRQRQMPEAVRGNGHDLLVLIDLQAEGREINLWASGKFKPLLTLSTARRAVRESLMVCHCPRLSEYSLLLGGRTKERER